MEHRSNLPPNPLDHCPDPDRAVFVLRWFGADAASGPDDSATTCPGRGGAQYRADRHGWSGAADRLGDGVPHLARCTDTTLASTAALGVHGVIEFGNRLLGVVLEVVGILLLLTLWRMRPTVPSSWRWLALVQALVVPAQAVVGGILVLTHLNAWVRTLHFLVSFPITFAAVALLRLILDGRRSRRRLVRPELRVLTGALLVVSAAVLIVGSLVSGTGPHAGDPGSPRLPLDPQTVTQVHVDLVWLLVGLAFSAALVARAQHAPTSVQRPLTCLIALIVVQGALGYVQYFTGAPPLLVGVHMLGAAGIFTLAAWSHVSGSGPDVALPSPSSAAAGARTWASVRA